MKRISDLGLASLLSCTGYKIKSIQRNKKRCEFLFENSPDLEKTILSYYNHAAKVDPLLFMETLRHLKALASIK